MAKKKKRKNKNKKTNKIGFKGFFIGLCIVLV